MLGIILRILGSGIEQSSLELELQLAGVLDKTKGFLEEDEFLGSGINLLLRCQHDISCPVTPKDHAGPIHGRPWDWVCWRNLKVKFSVIIVLLMVIPDGQKCREKGTRSF